MRCRSQNYEKQNLFLYFSQVKSLVTMEEQLQSQFALIAKDRDDAWLLMTIPGIGCYTALSIVADFGSIGKFPTKHHLCSYAVVIPKTDNLGARVAKHNYAKK